MWPYFNVPLEGHIKWIWLYIDTVQPSCLKLDYLQYLYIAGK